MIGAINSYYGHYLQNSYSKQNASAEEKTSAVEREKEAVKHSEQLPEGFTQVGNSGVQVKSSSDSENAEAKNSSANEEVKALKQFNDNLEIKEYNLKDSPVDLEVDPLNDFAHNLNSSYIDGDYESREGVSQNDFIQGDYESKEGIAAKAEHTYNSIKNYKQDEVESVSIIV